jgi:uncharacterized membrane protein YkoI
MLTVFTVVVLALAASGSPENGNITRNEEKQKISEESENINNTTNSSKGANVKISPAEAQEIAAGFIKESKATVGIPQLDEINGQMVYTVPILINGTPVGEININALTGKNMGGAGGVP